MVRVYLAGNIREQGKFKEYVGDLERNGLTVVSTWHRDSQLAEELKENRHVGLGLISSLTMMQSNELYREQSVDKFELTDTTQKTLQRCREEIESADLIIAFTDGGSVEAGYALAKGKVLITVGDLISPLSFALLPEFKATQDWFGALVAIEEAVRRQAFAEIASESNQLN